MTNTERASLKDNVKMDSPIFTNKVVKMPKHSGPKLTTVNMINIKSLLESSTIHGLIHISTNQKLMRLFWIIVVIAGFTGAGMMIYQSFQSWEGGKSGQNSRRN